jgi:hypothetical protein
VSATRWKYFATYQDDIEAALRQAQRAVLASGDFRWPDGLGPRPTTLEELAQARGREQFFEEGTGSILDVDRVVEADQPPSEGVVRGLAPTEIAAIFGAERPTRAGVDAAYESGLLPFDRSRWAGRWLVLFEGAQLSEIAFWGSSGD